MTEAQQKDEVWMVNLIETEQDDDRVRRISSTYLVLTNHRNLCYTKEYRNRSGQLSSKAKMPCIERYWKAEATEVDDEMIDRRQTGLRSLSCRRSEEVYPKID